MKGSSNKGLLSKILIAAVVCLIVLIMVAANTDLLSNLLFGNDALSGTNEEVTPSPGSTQDIGTPQYLANTIGSNSGVVAGSDDSTAGYPMEYADIDAGKYHILMADLDGFVYSRGSNYSQQLGLSNGTVSNNDTDETHYYSYLQPVSALNSYVIKKVAAGGYHSLAIGFTYNGTDTAITSSNYKVFSWGRQASGRLGNGVTADTNTGIPQDISANFSFESGEFPIDVEAGEHHSMLLTNKGNVYTWGSNWYGQLGNGGTTGSASGDKNVPVKVMLNTTTALTGVTQISAGSVHSLALTNSGELYSWGGNTNCQLGIDGITSHATYPARRFTSSSPTSTFTYISAGELHNIALNGTAAYAWGDNRGSKLGAAASSGNSVNDPANRSYSLVSVAGSYSLVSAGGGGSLLINTSKQLYVMGYGRDTYYGVNGTTATPQLVPSKTDFSNANINFIDMGGSMSVIKNSSNQTFTVGYAAGYNDYWYSKAEPPYNGTYSDNVTRHYDTRPLSESYNITTASAAQLINLTPRNNIIGLPITYNTTRLLDSASQVVSDKVAFTGTRVKLTSFLTEANFGSIRVKQLTKAEYDGGTPTFSGDSYTKSIVINKEGYYAVQYKTASGTLVRKFKLANLGGPEVELNTVTNPNRLFASISFYDAYGIKSVSVNGTAVLYGGGTESYTASKADYSNVYDATFEITRNSQTTFTIVVTDIDGKTTTKNYSIDTVVSLISNGYTKSYDGNARTVEPLFYSKARGEFNLATFTSNYSGFSVTSMKYAGGSSYDSYTAPINADANAYTATYKVMEGSTERLSRTVNIVINKTTPVITASSTPITYGQDLSSTNLNGTAVNPNNTGLTLANEAIKGAFLWPGSIPTTRPSVTYTGSYSVTFVPQAGTLSATNYNSNTYQVTLTINKATPTLSAISATEITYEQAMSAAIVTGTALNYNANPAITVGGTWSWKSDAISPSISAMPGVKQSGSYPILFTPNSTESVNYVSVVSEATLTVNPKDQTMEFDAFTVGNPGVRDETIATEKADFEVAWSTGEITLTAYTTAVYPTERVISYYSSDTNIARVMNSETTIVNRAGTNWSKTTVTLKFGYKDGLNNPLCGIVTIAVNQNDSTYNPSEDQLGNYKAVPAISYKIYIKKEQTAASFVNINKTFGADPFAIEPNLNSGRTNYTLISSNENVITLTMSGAARTATIQNVGTSTITLSHPGYIDPNIESEAYMSMTKSITVTVASTPLNIKLKDTAADYGSVPEFTYIYTGFVYGQNAASAIKNLTNDYLASAMKNVIRLPEGGYGSYTVTPYGAENFYASYPNYSITFTSGNLTINPKSVVATIENTEKLYGDNNPNIPINYSGFITNESILTEGIVAPVVSYGNVGTYTNVGTYPIILQSGYANNYSFNITDTATLTINKRPVNISTSGVNRDYNGLAVTLTHNITGIDSPDATTPVNAFNPNEVIYEYSVEGGLWTSVTPVNVGVYNFRITYRSASYDNYADTVQVFNNVIAINAVNPRLFLELRMTDYTGSPISALATASSIVGGSVPANANNLRYRYSVNGTDFIDAAPHNAGTYTVEVIYQPASVDNYKNYSQRFENILKINKVNVLITLPIREETYASANGLNPNSVKAAEANVTGVGSEANYLPKVDRFVYQYFVDNDWTGNAPMNAGSYSVMVTYTALESENYLTTTTIFNNRVRILPASILDTIKMETKDVFYTGVDTAANDATYGPIPGGTQPLGSITYEYQLGSSNFSPALVKNANTYNVKVTYTTVPGDNYMTVSKEFSAALIIRKVAPTIALSEFKFEFNGANRSVTAATVTGVNGGTTPMGRLSYLYLVNNEWTTLGPRNFGRYDVKVTYTSAAEDNYSTTTVILPERIQISKAKPEITLVAKKYDYTGAPISATDAIISGKATDPEGPQNATPNYSYYIGGTWVIDPPTNSGAYNVKVSYVAPDDSNYTSLEKIFSNALIIKNIPPEIEQESLTYEYDGTVHEMKIATIKNGTGDYDKTRFTYEYNLGDNRWSSKAPVNVGTYQVRVRYNEAEVDNYSTKSQTFENALTILPRAITVTPDPNQNKNYDGKPVNGETISFIKPDLIAGNNWGGALKIGSSEEAPTAAGSYFITLGNLNAGKNYTVTLSDNEVIYKILPREIELIFPDLDFKIYDGKPKTPKIQVNPASVVENQTVVVYTRYIGNNINAGSFIAEAYIIERNYMLPKNYSVEYSISPATMSDLNKNIFTSYTVGYNGDPHQLVVTNPETGSRVFYDGPTEYTARGEYTVTATITKPNYYDKVVSATLTITKGICSIQVNLAKSEIFYGDPLPTLVWQRNDDKDDFTGRVFLNEDQQLMPGTAEYNWTFIPDDLENYDTATGKIKIDVQKTQAEVIIKGNLKQYASDPQNIQVNLVGSGEKAITPKVFFTSASGTIYETMPSAPGRYTVSIIFEGDEYNAPVTYTTLLEIKEKPNYLWIYLLSGGLFMMIIASALFFRHRGKSQIG